MFLSNIMNWFDGKKKYPIRLRFKMNQDDPNVVLFIVNLNSRLSNYYLLL